MKKIAFIFMNLPHGKSSSREGLDAILASTVLTDNIGVFFISDGVCQLLKYQCPKEILAHDYIASYPVLPLYNVYKYYISLDDLKKRGFSNKNEFVLPVLYMSSNQIKKQLITYDVILTY
uniref:Sulfurtransferase complex subunit TusC n=1 Tax=Candidatus Aschnera chinzeii TaxID=1485666 RepID=A0AAT9G4P3_9ENTR|nr:MAG: sulfurtransferase complex subunit TusC [Candidatus Aschnera chinzeii]